MSDKDTESNEKPTAPTAPRRDPTTTIVAWVATVIAIIALGGGLYLEKEREKLKDRINDVRLELRDTTQMLTRRDDEFASRAALERALAESRQALQALERRQDRFEDILGRMRSVDPSARDAWFRAEVEYVLRVALRYVEVDRDPAAAVLALRAAQQTMERMEDPAYSSVLERVAIEIAALERVDTPDMELIVLTLDGVGNRVHSLPLAEVHGAPQRARRDRPPGFAGVDWSGMWRSIRSSFRSMVTVRREGRPERVVLAPEEVQAIHLNAQLKLESARYSALRRDDQNFRVSVRNTRRWIETWYDTEDATVQTVLDELRALERQELSPDLPDISGSLRLLRSAH